VRWDESSQQRFLDSIAAESARMGRLVGDLLDFSAIDSGTLRLVRDWCSLDLVLEAACRCVTEAPPALIELRLEPGLPTVWADHDRLEQVFVNLLDNAVRHAADVTHITVTSSLDSVGNTVTVRVCDDGGGIDHDLVGRVFLPRERAASDDAGAGLGLAIARGIVDAHDGTICIEPTRTGTTVAVTIPVVHADFDERRDSFEVADDDALEANAELD
jgi:signal transduction histidine kinase